jgi:hypothetical protein
LRQALHANCFVPAGVNADLLLTDEPSVAAAGRSQLAIPTAGPEDLVAAELAHRTSIEMWRLAFSWFRSGDRDPTIVHGISAGDLAGLEAALSVLLPAARGALSMSAAISHEGPPERLISVAPDGTPNGGRYDRLERLAAEAAIAAARHACGGALQVERVVSREPRNALLRDKYARTRDPELLLHTNAMRTARRLVFAAADQVAVRRRAPGPTWLVVEYNPTLSFARAYVARAGARRRLVRWLADPRELLAATRAGDIVQAPAALPVRDGGGSGAISRSLAAAGNDLAGTRQTVDGVPLWPLVRERLFELVDTYSRYADIAAPVVESQLRRYRVDAVLVPFDTNPAVRLLVRVAQSVGIPTFVINDGYKGDDIQVEGLSTDVALAWSSAVADHYFVRHPGKTVVTGNPKFSALRGSRWRPPDKARLRVLVGSFTFSPVDLNCRRGDAERFLDAVLSGLAAARPAVADDVVVKLHPADEPAHYRDLLERNSDFHVNLITAGDISAQFAHADLYVTTYSTSLLEAAVMIPVIYYRVNDQRLGPPFEDDEFLSRRTAETPSELASLIGDRVTLAASPPPEWFLRYLGPTGADEQVVAAIESELRSRHADAERPTAPDGVPQRRTVSR